ncbi:hypothetical protein D3C76_1021250 [compost metagenome]
MHRTQGTTAALLYRADDGFYFQGGGLGSLSQGPHLIGHHGETAAAFSRPGRLDRGIQRQQIGLFSDASNHIQHRADITYLACQALQRISGMRHIASQRLDGADCPDDAIFALSSTLIGYLGHQGGRSSIARHLFDGAGQFGNGCNGLVELLALPLQSLTGIFGHSAQCLGSRAQLFG